MIPQLLKYELDQFFNYSIQSFQPVGGGSINEAYFFKVGGDKYFLKFNSSIRYPKIILHELHGLEAIAKLQIISTPEIIFYRQVGEYELLVLPYIPQEAVGKQFWIDFGRQLAQMHQLAKANQFGWTHSNYIGSLAQNNDWEESFTNFWIKRRIRPQLRLAMEHQQLSTTDLAHFEALFNRIEEIFPKTKPTLVHGDLWSGNFIANNSQGPVLIDPSIHYGAAETDLAFTHLFGGFDPEFYEAYAEVNPLAPAFKERIKIYNLYPLLVHLNLFGASYYPSIQKVIRQFK